MKKEPNKSKYRGRVCGVIICILSVIVIIQFTFIYKFLKEQELGVYTEEKQNNIIVLDCIETPIIDLMYRSTAVNCLRAVVSDTEPYEVTILADLDKTTDIELLSFYFNREIGTNLGKIKDEDGNIVTVSFEKYGFEDRSVLSESDIERLKMTQEDLLDDIVANLPYVEIAEQVSKENIENEYITIETSYTQLLYPKKWEEYLETEIIETDVLSVVFYCHLPNREKVELFSYIFGDSADMLIGKLDGTEIGISFSELNNAADWSNEEKQIFYEMQEDMNIIIDGLAQNESFQIAQ